MDGTKSDYELGLAFLEAFVDAVDHYTERMNTLDGPGFYDPCGDTERRLDAELHAALQRLVAAVRAI